MPIYSDHKCEPDCTFDKSFLYLSPQNIWGLYEFQAQCQPQSTCIAAPQLICYGNGLVRSQPACTCDVLHAYRPSSGSGGSSACQALALNTSYSARAVSGAAEVRRYEGCDRRCLGMGFFPLPLRQLTASSTLLPNVSIVQTAESSFRKRSLSSSRASRKKPCLNSDRYSGVSGCFSTAEADRRRPR